jgi:membrane-associated phospholipid phosphatase
MQKWVGILLFLLSISAYSQNWDIELLRKINTNRNTHLDPSCKFVTNTVAPLSIVSPLALYGIANRNNDSIMRKKSICIGVSVLTTVTLFTALKYSVRRQRAYEKYDDIDNATTEKSYSFPSGHTSDAFALATSLSLNYRKWYVIIPSYTWASAVAYSRLHLGVHYPSDVFAGALIGAGTSYLCYKGQKWLTNNRKYKKRNVIQ